MKQLFIGVAIFLSCAEVKAQEIKLQNVYQFPGENLPERDTSKVLYLVSDTSSGHQNVLPFIIFGFVTYVKKGDQYNEFFWLEPDNFLDDQMHPLSKSIIIWQYKTLK